MRRPRCACIAVFLALLVACVPAGAQELGPSSTAGSLSAKLQGHKVSLSWTAGADTGDAAVSYNVYRSTDGSNYLKIGTVPVATLAFDDQGVGAGVTYSYFVKSADAAGNESDPSNIVSATVPTP